MPIKRAIHNNLHHYTVISNRLVIDKNLSLQAKGLMLYFLSKPDNFYFTIRSLLYAHSNEIFSLRSTIKELIFYGYVLQNRVRNPDGTFGSYYFLILESPIKTTTSSKSDYSTVDDSTVDDSTVDYSTPAKDKIVLNTEKEVRSSSSTKVVNITADDDSPKLKKIKKETKSIDSFQNKISPEEVKLKNETIAYLQSLNIMNINFIIRKYGLKNVSVYAHGLSGFIKKANSPTAYLVASIKNNLPIPSDPEPELGLSVFQPFCSKCTKMFSYLDYEPTRTLCPKCELKKDS